MHKATVPLSMLDVYSSCHNSNSSAVVNFALIGIAYKHLCKLIKFVIFRAVCHLSKKKCIRVVPPSYFGRQNNYKVVVYGVGITPHL